MRTADILEHGQIVDGSHHVTVTRDDDEVGGHDYRPSLSFLGD